MYPIFYVGYNRYKLCIQDFKTNIYDFRFMKLQKVIVLFMKTQDKIQNEVIRIASVGKITLYKQYITFKHQK